MTPQRSVLVKWLARGLAILLLLVGCGLVGASLVGRQRAAVRSADAAAATFSPPALETPQPKLVSVISDDLAGADPGSTAAAAGPPSWISIVPQRISIRLSPFVSAGSGYTARGDDGDPSGTTFVDRAAQISASTAVTVFVGGAADQDQSRVTISKAATRAFSAARSAAPSSRIVVVGPVWPTAEVPAGVLAVRDALRSAAAVTDVAWVDPISRGWLTGSDGAEWDAVTDLPTAAGQRELGTLMTKVIQQELQ